MARLVEWAPAHEVAPGQLCADRGDVRYSVGEPPEPAKSRVVVPPHSPSWRHSGSDLPRVAPLRRPPDIDRAFGHPPAAGALPLDSLRLAHGQHTAPVPFDPPGYGWVQLGQHNRSAHTVSRVWQYPHTTGRSSSSVSRYAQGQPIPSQLAHSSCSHLMVSTPPRWWCHGGGRR